jgi:Tol biopolymer transport system component
MLFVQSGNLWLWEGETGRQLTNSGDAFQPAWSPDGRWIVYETGVLTQADLGLAWQPTGLAKVQTDGSNMAQILQEASLPAWGR